MSNMWVDSAERRKRHHRIENKAFDAWSEGASFGDFLDSLSEDEVLYLRGFSIRDFASDPNEPSFGVEIVGKT